MTIYRKDCIKCYGYGKITKGRVLTNIDCSECIPNPIATPWQPIELAPLNTEILVKDTDGRLFHVEINNIADESQRATMKYIHVTIHTNKSIHMSSLFKSDITWIPLAGITRGY